LERDQVIQVGRLRGIEKFEGEIENFILNTFINSSEEICSVVLSATVVIGHEIFVTDALWEQ